MVIPILSARRRLVSDVAVSGVDFLRLWKDENQTSFTSGALTWQQKTSDPFNMHEDIVNPNRITIPSAFNNRYAELKCNIAATVSDWADIEGRKDGSRYGGAMKMMKETGSIQWVNGVSCPIQIVTNNYLDILASFGATATVNALPETWAEIAIKPTDFRGALIRHTTEQNISTNVETQATLGTTVYDHASYKSGNSLVAKNDDFLVQLIFTLRIGTFTATANGLANIKKNGAHAYGLPYDRQRVGSGGSQRLGGKSAPLIVSGGEAFTLHGLSTGTLGPQFSGGFQALSIERLPSDLKYCLLHRATNQAVTSGDWRTIEWDAEIEDVGGWHSTVSNLQNIVVPAGIDYVEVISNIFLSGTTGNHSLRCLLNGTEVTGIFKTETTTQNSASDATNGVSAIFAVEEGDIITIQVIPGVSTNITSSTATWVSVQEVRVN